MRDSGPSLEGEMMWFNMSPGAPIPEYRKAWFRSRNFRRAVSHSIRRDDLCRVVYRGHASAGIGPFSAANLFWFNQALKPHAFDLAEAKRLLAADGFRAQRRRAPRLRTASGGILAHHQQRQSRRASASPPCSNRIWRRWASS